MSELERLQAENARMREALEVMLTDRWQDQHVSERGWINEQGEAFIRAALSGASDKPVKHTDEPFGFGKDLPPLLGSGT